MATSNTRQRRFIAAGDAPPIPEHGVSTRYMRLQNTLVAWSEDSADSATLRQDASAEIFVILPDTGAVLSGNGAKAEAPPRSISMLPAGPTTIDLTLPGRVIHIFSPVPEALAPRAINGGLRRAGSGYHLMLNIFAPARADHIRSGMVLSAEEYVPA